MSSSSPSVQADQKKTILGAISVSTVPSRVTRTYLLGLAFTACAVLLLPLLYLAVLALVLEGTFLLVLRFDSIFVGCHPLVKYSAILVILCVGVSCVLGLVKPFFASSTVVKRPDTLRRDAEPLLYDYVNRLCDVLGARRPTDIHVTCDLNAAAEFQRGWQHPFGHRGVSLYLGLPLVAGLTLRQFTGILAHELGHFSQRKAMWFENIVRRANHWFLRAANERDRIDIWLTEHCSSGGVFSIPCYFARFVVWGTRCMLKGLARVGTMISCLMSRQMEFSADRCQIRAVGSRTMSATLWRLREMSLAHQVSFRDVAAFHEEGRLPDSMADLVLANLEFITPKLKKKLHRMMIEEKSGPFDSHPADTERIAMFADDSDPGFFRSGTLPIDLPATALFSRFDELSKTTSIQFFENALKQKVHAKTLHPVAKLLERQSAQIEASRALRRYFQTDIPVQRPLPIPSQAVRAPDNPRDTANELKLSRARMLNELPIYKNLVPRYRTAEETLLDTVAAQALLQAQIPFEPSNYRIANATADAISAKISRAREGTAALSAKLLAFETAAGDRLSFALQLLHVPAVIERIPNGEDLKYQTTDFLQIAVSIGQLLGEVPSLRLNLLRLQVLLEKTKGTGVGDRARSMIDHCASSLRERLTAIQAEMSDQLYPFDHARAETTLKQFVLPHIPGERSTKGIVEATEQLQSRLYTTQLRLFARLASAAEKIEEAIGMSPLSAPQRDMDE